MHAGSQARENSVGKSPKDSVDFRSGSESLLRAVRADHEASAADCARVEAELARRLAAGAPAKLALDGDTPAISAKPARTFTPGTVAKLWISVSLLAAGSLAIVRTVDFAHSRASRATTSLEPAPTPSAAPARDRALDISPEETSTAPVPELQDTPLLRARARHGGSARVAPSRTALRDSAAPRPPIAKHSASASANSDVADEPISPTPASVSARASAEPSSGQPSAQPAPSRSTSSEQPDPTTSARPRAQPRAAAALETPPIANEASARTSPQSQTRPVRVDDSADARAELALVERMHAAMRAAKPATALALCAEHAKRWPRGLFAEEREAVSAIASCVLRSDDAASRARRFLSKHPRAPTAPRVAAACAPLWAATDPASPD
jgi:hypothetical protein